MTEQTITEMLDELAQNRADQIATLRRARAELEVLDGYDERRRFEGHDYGGGQRVAELGRKQAEVDALSSWARSAEIDESAPTADELRETAQRLLGPRLQRVKREGYRSSTRATSKTLRALERTLDHFGVTMPDRIHTIAVTVQVDVPASANAGVAIDRGCAEVKAALKAAAAWPAVVTGGRLVSTSEAGR